MDKLRVLDMASFIRLLMDLQGQRWSWRLEDLPAVASGLGWRNLEVVSDNLSASAFADTPNRFGGGEILVYAREGRVQRIMIRVSDQLTEELATFTTYLEGAWQEYVVLAESFMGEPSRRVNGPNPEVQWRTEEVTISIKNVRLALLVNWANTCFQDYWNNLD